MALDHICSVAIIRNNSSTKIHNFSHNTLQALFVKPIIILYERNYLLACCHLYINILLIKPKELV